MTKTLRSVDARVVYYYSYVPDAQSPATTRGESVNFLHDVVLTIERAGFGVEGVPIRPDRVHLLDQLHHQLELLGKDSDSSGRKTIILIDGLDHIDREQHPDRSLLLDLPTPESVPDGVYFILGTQTDMILPAHIRSSVQKGYRRVEMQSLERQQVFAVITSAETATKLTDDLKETVFQLSGGHPLYLAYIINRIKETLNSEDLNKELRDMVPFEGDVEATYHSYWEQFREDTDLRHLLGLLSRIRGEIDLSWVREWAEISAVERVGDKFAHYFRADGNTRWRFFHNSFRLFLVEKTAEFPRGTIDPKLHRDFHLKLADRYAEEPEDTPLAWEEIYHRASGRQLEEVLEIATQSFFRKQFLSLRPIDAINADILTALRAAAELENPISVARLCLIGSELSQRDFYLDESGLFSILWRLDQRDLALNRLMQGNQLLVKERSALRAARILKHQGYDDEARRVFELAEPITLLYGAESAVTDDSLSLVESWLRVAVLFQDADLIIKVIRRLQYRELGRCGGESEELTLRLQARLLTQLGSHLTASSRRSDLQKVLSAFCNSSDIDVVARFRLIMRILKELRIEGNQDRAQELLNSVIDTDRSLFTSEDVTNLAEAVYRHLRDEELARELIKDVEQPELKSDLVSFYSDLAPFRHRFVLNRLLYALGTHRSPSDIVPDSVTPRDKGTVLLERGLCSIAQLWARAWMGGSMNRLTVKTEVLPLLRVAGMPDENLNELTTWYVFKQSRSEFYSLLVNAVGQHGHDALLGLAEALEEEWTDACSRGAWPIDERRNVILAFVRSDFSKFWATSRLQELDELVISTSDAAEVGERVNYCMRQAEAWLELFNKDRAQHFLDLALDVGYGIGYRKDYQLNRWIEWLGEINRIQPDEASSRLTRLAYAIEGLDDSTEGRATALAAEELLAVTFNWSPTRATKLLCWFLDRGLIGYKDGVGILIREALKSPSCPVQTVIQVFVELLLPFDKEGDSELIESILQHVVRIQGSDRFLEVAKHIALKTQILSIPQARGAWIKGLIRASEEMGFNSSILAIDLDGIKFAEEDTRNSNFLRLKGASEEVKLEDVQKQVTSISDVRQLLEMEDESSYFDWTPVIERLITEAVDEETTLEFAELFRCNRYHATELLSAICRHLNQIGSQQKAWNAGVESLVKSSPFGWNSWFDGGAKYSALRALGQIDKKKTVSLTYQTLVNDLEENRSFSEVAAGLREILELITCTLDVPAIWTEVEEHAEFLLLGGIASDLPNLFEEQREDTPQRALQTFLMECVCHPIRTVSHGAQRAIGTLILENPNDLTSILSQNLQKSECYQERILALLDSVDRIGPSPVTQLRSEVEALAESPNWAIQRIAKSIAEDQGWNSKSQQTNFKQLPWMHNLTIS